MSKGPAQGDFETPTMDEFPTPDTWPTEPDLVSEAPAPPDVDTETAVPDDPEQIGQLPTTSGTDAVAAIALIGAIALLGAGAALAWRRRRPTRW